MQGGSSGGRHDDGGQGDGAADGKKWEVLLQF